MPHDPLTDLLDLLPIPGEPGQEAAVAQTLTHKFLALGLTPADFCHDDANSKSEIAGQVGNLILQINGHGRGPRRMMSSHMDTIPGAVGCRPIVSENKIINDAPDRCLGGDARAGRAVLLAAIRSLLARNGDHPPWTFVFFVQEEIGLVGARWLNTHLLGNPLPSMAFNFDSADASDLIYAVIGTQRLHITITGQGCHTMNPEYGISAAEIFALASARMIQSGWHGRIHHPEGAGLANVGILRGGTGSNVVMPELYILLEARSHQKNFRTRILDQWKAALAHAVAECNAKSPKAAHPATVTYRPGPVYDPYELPQDAPVVQAAAHAMQALGLQPDFLIDNGGNDSAWITAHGIPAVCLGFGARQIHTTHEWIDIPEFTRCCQLASQLVAPTP